MIYEIILDSKTIIVIIKRYLLYYTFVYRNNYIHIQ